MYFAPGDQITRAEAASIIARILPANLRKGELKFTDAKQIPAWATDNIAILINAQFIKGYPDNTIRPQNKVTRAEAAVMLYNAY